MTATRVTTIRIPESMAEQVDMVARAEITTASAVIRTAITEHVERRKADPGFRARLAACIARDQALLAALTATEPAPVSGAGEVGSDG